jgi:O-antigen/teichoic acid export membrane protein
MSVAEVTVNARSGAAPVSTIDRQLRGSSLLLLGRGLSLALNMLIQVLIVRALSKGEYGAFTYALSLVVFWQAIVMFGLDRAIGRFVPIYHEEEAYDKIFGVILMALGVVVGLGAALVVFGWTLRGFLGGSLIDDPQAVTLVAILMALACFGALDSLLLGLLGVFGRPRAIFFRTYVLAPGLRLAVVAVVLLSGSGVVYLAAGYVAAAALGIAIYFWVLFRVLAAEGLLGRFGPRRLTFPVREVFSLTLPLLTTDLLYVAMLSSDAIILGHYHGAVAVGEFRVIQPAAALNELVLASFTVLYTPLAARLFARRDGDAIRTLYWRTAVWIATISFPIFALTLTAAGPVTTLLYGDRYAASATFLSILAVGYYFQAALGFNGTTLMVFGKTRYITVLNVAAMGINLALNLVLIPRYGALGAAVGTTGTFVAHNLLKQVALGRATGISPLDRRYLRVYGVIGAVMAVLLVAVFVVASGPVQLVLAVGGGLAVVLLNRRMLEVGQTFPELTRIPLVRRVIGAGNQG